MGLGILLCHLDLASWFLGRERGSPIVYTQAVRVPKPSLFAIVLLLVLLGLGVWANLYIAHQRPGVVAVSVDDRRWFSTTAPTPDDPGDWPGDWSGEQAVDWSGDWSVEWAGVPAEITAGLGRPMTWAWSSTRSYEIYQIAWAGDPLTNMQAGVQTGHEWSVLRMYHHGWPMDVLTRTSVITKNGRATTSAWPTPGGHPSTEASTYHPLGLIVNPFIYALPAWIVLMLVRHWLIRRRQRRRIARGLCGQCGYDLSATQALPTCPECGHGNMSQPAPVSA